MVTLMSLDALTEPHHVACHQTPAASTTLSELFSTRPNLETIDCYQQTREQMRSGIETSPSRLCPAAVCGRRRATTPQHNQDRARSCARSYSKLDNIQFGRPATFRSIPSRVADGKTQHSPMGSFDLDKREIAVSKGYIATKHNLRLNSHGLPTISIEGFWRV